MGAAMVVIPLAGLVLPILAILAAVLIDVAAVFWALYRLWHDGRGVRLQHAHPFSRMLHGFHRVPQAH